MSVIKYQFREVEKIKTSIWQDAKQGSVQIAKMIAQAISDKNEKGEKIVLGLSTGNSPILVYKELVRLHKEEGLSFKNVISYNLDEYYPMQPDASQSYVAFMKFHLFDHIDILPENIHVPDGTLPLEEVEAYCTAYDQRIHALGGIDIQLLGIGRNGHIGFNEPGSFENSPTRLVRLDATTRIDASNDFGGEENVPYRAITLGLKTVMNAKSILLCAWGLGKASIIQKALEGPITNDLPASLLQNHPNTEFFIDNAAAENLTRFKTPWLVALCNWTPDLICKAVVWLSLKSKKPILKLTAEDYKLYGLSDLLVEYATAYEINIVVFNRLQHTISGWPGGKPDADDSTRPERANPAKKRVIIFSPHPDDDVISMGGTFLRLVDQGHEVHVAYQTSGNIAVHDHDAFRFLSFTIDLLAKAEMNEEIHQKIAEYEQLKSILAAKKPGEKDHPGIRQVKGLIRRGEASAGARFCGLSDANIHFMDLPFYETGATKKSPLSEADVNQTAAFIKNIEPHQIFAAGDLADPHGTHKVCLDVILLAMEELKRESWISDCWLWLYRGAWHEWPVEEIEMAVPLSPQELVRKRKAIFMHQSQKDTPPFAGNDPREFWQRAEERNKATADTYHALGFAEYEAMEAFRRWKFNF
ncbi:MAG: glucosamine-6-phosphate deaminase [Bacteroidetes bacterium]|nr:glucosamine-6-phosphate deaminase [Bacteroidota bacterium]